jgi:hypothetical protein
MRSISSSICIQASKHEFHVHEMYKFSGQTNGCMAIQAATHLTGCNFQLAVHQRHPLAHQVIK